MISCKEMADVLMGAASRDHEELVVPTEALMVFLKEEAWGFIGSYQTGWAPLKPTTIARKMTGDTPLLETGEMRDSIEHRAAPTIYGAIGEIGSNDPIALYQEMGTSRSIPPRSFLGLAMSRSEEAAIPLFGKFALSLFAPR